MTKKDYELIADSLRTSYFNTHKSRDVRLAIIDMADALQITNSKFNRDKFLKACGIEV